MALPIVCNIAKGRIAELARLGATSDALVAIPLESAGLEADSVLKDKDTFADMVSGATNEQTTMGRKTLTGVTFTVDDTGDLQKVDADNPTWAAATGNDTGALAICYDDNTGTGTDANLIPLVVLTFVSDPNGGDITYNFHADGFFKAT